MAKVVLIGLDASAARQLSRTLAADGHEVIHNAEDIQDADIVFHGGIGRSYLQVLNEVRTVRPSLPFVVVAVKPDTAEWLDALEAGATDYCAAPFEPRYIHWLMELTARDDSRALAY